MISSMKSKKIVICSTWPIFGPKYDKTFDNKCDFTYNWKFYQIVLHFKIPFHQVWWNLMTLHRMHTTRLLLTNMCFWIWSTNYVTMKINEIEMNYVHISLLSSEQDGTLLVIYDKWKSLSYEIFFARCLQTSHLIDYVQ